MALVMLTAQEKTQAPNTSSSFSLKAEFIIAVKPAQGGGSQVFLSSDFPRAFGHPSNIFVLEDVDQVTNAVNTALNRTFGR